MEKLKTVKVVVFVDGEQRFETYQDVPDWAVDYVIGAVAAQVEDPDLEAAEDSLVHEDDREIPVEMGTIVGIAPSG